MSNDQENAATDGVEEPHTRSSSQAGLQAYVGGSAVRIGGQHEVATEPVTAELGVRTYTNMSERVPITHLFIPEGEEGYEADVLAVLTGPSEGDAEQSRRYIARAPDGQYVVVGSDGDVLHVDPFAQGSSRPEERTRVTFDSDHYALVYDGRINGRDELSIERDTAHPESGEGITVTIAHLRPAETVQAA
ncbi:MAG TPA: hypothetical protein VGS28_02775 [Candidatus Saccharimonadales bacterium]|nr:hypothetical protein [Candidatus Saccharimonadales bacterium]